MQRGPGQRPAAFSWRDTRAPALTDTLLPLSPALPPLPATSLCSSNLFIIVGDYWFFARTYSWHVWVCLALMAGSVVAGGATDIHFTARGYAWQMANNVFTGACQGLAHETCNALGSACSSLGHLPRPRVL